MCRNLISVSLLGLLFIGCTGPNVRDKLWFPQTITPNLIDAALRERPVAPDQNLRPETLTMTDEFSLHLLQFRTGEARHIHKAHDLTFVCYRGEGELFVFDEKSRGDIRYVSRPGQVCHIPRGTPHFVRNTGPEPLVAVLVFTPPYDLKDSVPAPLEVTPGAKPPITE